MRWPTLGPRDRRALRLGAWVVLPALFLLLVVRPYQRALSAAGEELDSQRSLLARELGALRDAPRDAQLVQHGRSALAEERSRLFEAADAVAASAQLGSYVAARAAESGVDVGESETIAVADSTAVAAVDIAATGNVLEIVEFLRALENGPNLARVERIVIAPAPGASQNNGTVTLRMTVTGLSQRASDDASADPRAAPPPGSR